MSVVRNAIVALEKAQIPIFRDTIAKTLESVARNKLSLKDILKNIDVTTKDARDMIQKEINAMKPQ
jgi:3-methyladenine DNA glycosylase AlkD